VQDIPCIIMYSSLEHCVECIKEINSLDSKIADEMIRESVEIIKKVDGWSDLRSILSLKMLTL
jgi:hypothetical protein